MQSQARLTRTPICYAHSDTKYYNRMRPTVHCGGITRQGRRCRAYKSRNRITKTKLQACRWHLAQEVTDLPARIATTIESPTTQPHLPTREQAPPQAPIIDLESPATSPTQTEEPAAGLPSPPPTEVVDKTTLQTLDPHLSRESTPSPIIIIDDDDDSPTVLNDDTTALDPLTPTPLRTEKPSACTYTFAEVETPETIAQLCGSFNASSPASSSPSPEEGGEGETTLVETLQGLVAGSDNQAHGQRKRKRGSDPVDGEEGREGEERERKRMAWAWGKAFDVFWKYYQDYRE